MLCETLHNLRSQRFVVQDEGFTSPDIVVNDKHVRDKMLGNALRNKYKIVAKQREQQEPSGL